MSCYWDLRCLDCEVDHGFDNLNHEDKLMMSLAKIGPQLADLAPVLETLRDAAYSDVRLFLRYNDAPVDFAWFAKHGRHRLMAVDEYGRCRDECGEHYTYCECKHRRMCRRPKGHDGLHDENREAVPSPSEVKE